MKLKYTIEYMDGKTEEIRLTLVIQYSRNNKFIGTGVSEDYLMSCLEEKKPIVLAKEVGVENIEAIINTANIRKIY